MISQTALDVQAERLGIAVGDQAVAAVVQAEPIVQDTNGKFDVNRFRSLLQQNGLTEAGYLATTKQEMQRRAMTALAGRKHHPAPYHVEALTRYRDETRDGRYVSFSVSAKPMCRHQRMMN